MLTLFKIIISGFILLSTVNLQWYVYLYIENWQFEDVHFASDSVGFTIANEGGYTGVVIKTTNGGSTWVQKYVEPGKKLFSIFFINDLVGWAVGRYGVIIHTEDGGDTWNYQTSGTSSHYLNCVYFTDELNGWIVGSPSGGGDAIILKTSDGGTNWISIYNFPHLDLRGYYSVVFKDSTTGWAVGRYAQIIKTTDGGLNWSEKYIVDRHNGLVDIFYIDGDLWAVGGDGFYDVGKIYYSSDLGDNWSYEYSNGRYFRSAYFINDSYGWVVGDTGLIVYTTNGGFSWSEAISPTVSSLRSICFSDDSTGWITGWFGYFLSTKSPPSGILSEIKEDLVPDFQIYPNPFNSITTISFSLPQNTYVRLSVFSITGEEIEIVTDREYKKGAHKLQFLSADLTSGIYIALLETEKSSVGKKIVLIK